MPEDLPVRKCKNVTVGITRSKVINAFLLLVLCTSGFKGHVFEQFSQQGVVAGSRIYHQRRRSGFPGDTWPDQPCVPANFSGMGRGSTQEPPSRFSFFQNASNQNQTCQFHVSTCTVIAI